MARDIKMDPFPDDPTPTGKGEDKEPKPENQFDPGELAPHWDSAYPNVIDELSERAVLALKHLCDLVGNKDIAARRWEVVQAWEARLFYRGYQYILPRKGGGWVVPPFANSFNVSGKLQGDQKFYGFETNIYTTYGEIVQAALTRDVPRFRAQPQDPFSGADLTAADAASNYARVFMRNNDLKDFQTQLANYLWTDGRCIIITDHVLDAQRFGREDYEEETAAVPETEAQEDQPVVYLIRHGETENNLEGEQRGRSEVGLDQTGQREIIRTAHFLEGKGIQAILTSPVERAAQSAQLLAETLKVLVEPDDRIASLNIGTQMVGEKTTDTIPKMEEAFDNPDEPIGGDGETPNQFNQRVREGLFQVLQSGTLAAMVTHDSVIAAVFRMLHGSDMKGTSLVEPGGVVAVYANQDGTYSVRTVYPYLRPEPSSGLKRGRPRGKEIVRVGGKLEGKVVPINSRCQSDVVSVLFAEEYDVAYVKAMFPDKANEIEAGGASSGENELDRIARINAALSLEASYVTGDSMVRDCTVQRYWFRPGFLMEVKDEEVREELMDKFPDGVHVILAGKKGCLTSARNESMDDHVTVIHASPGTGQNRIALGTKLLSLQKRLNNWVDLLNAFLIKTVPHKWLPTEMVDPEAIRDQTNSPGAIDFYSLSQLPPGMNFQQLMAVEPVPTPQAFIIDAIQGFATEFPQLFSHAHPTIFGAQSNQDVTATAAIIQRDQALGCLSAPWHAIQMATCNYFRQAVQLAAQCRTKPIIGQDGDTIIRIEVGDLKGNILVYPEQDANFPESWTQKQSRWQQILQEKDPLVTPLVEEPRNIKAAISAVGMDDLKSGIADSYDKQLGEFDILLKTAPVPNPEKAQAIQAVERVTLKLQETVDPQQQIALEQQIQQAQQEIAQMPDMVSTVPVDQQVDRHAAESAACQDWLNSPDGRKFHNGTAQQKAAWQNVRLHKMEHDQYVTEPIKIKPVSFSANLKDLTPDETSQILQSEGVQSNPAGVVQSREFGAVIKKMGKVNPTGMEG